MCDVALPGRGLATLVSDEVVMTGTQWQLQRAASSPGASLPTPPDMPGPALTRNIGAEEMEVIGSST